MADAAERLRLARGLLTAEALDIAAALALLNTMPDTLGAPEREAIDHAKRAVAAAPGGDQRHEAVARYLIARIVVLLEREAASPVQGS